MKSVGLQHTTVEKDLGVWIGKDLKALSYVAKAVSKANQILGGSDLSVEHSLTSTVS